MIFNGLGLFFLFDLDDCFVRFGVEVSGGVDVSSAENMLDDEKVDAVESK